METNMNFLSINCIFKEGLRFAIKNIIS